MFVLRGHWFWLVSWLIFTSRKFVELEIEMKNKVLKTLTLTTVAATALVAQQAYADEVAEAPTSSSSNTANAEVSTIVTADQVADAKAIADTAANQVTYQQASLVTAEETARTAQTDLHQAEQTLASAQELATKATDDTIATAEKAIISAEQKVVDAQNQVTSAEQTTTTAQEQADKAQTEANKAKDAADLAKSQADNSKADLEALQNSQEEQAINKAQEDLKAAQEEVANKTTAVTTAEQNLETAKASDAKLEADRASAKEGLESAQEKESDTKIIQEKAKVRADVTAQELVSAQVEADALKPKVNYQINVNIPTEVKQALIDILNFDPAAYTGITVDYSKGVEYAKAQLQEIEEKSQPFYDQKDSIFAKYEYNTTGKAFSVTFEGGDEFIDPENLTIEQAQLANLFYVDVLNAIRHELGLSEAYTSQALIDVATNRAKAYDQLNTYIYHDNEIIRSSAKPVFGRNVAFSESLHSGGTDKVQNGKMKLSDYLEELASQIHDYVFYDGGIARYGHMEMHMTDKVFGVATYDEEALILDFSAIGLPDIHPVRTVVAGSRENYIDEVNAKVRATKIEKPDTSAYEIASAKVLRAKAENNKAQTDLTQAQEELTVASQVVASAQSTYSALINAPLQTPEAEKALEVARVNLASAQEVLATAQNQWQLAEAKAATLATEIAKAQTTYDTLLETATKLKAQADAKQADADKAKDNLAQAQTQLEEAHQAVTRAEKEVVLAKDNLSTLKEAQVNLVKAQEAYALAQADAKQADQNLSEAQAKLADFKAAYEKAYADYLALKNIYDLQTMVTPQPEIKDETKPETPFVSPFAEDQLKSDAKTIADGFKTKDEAAVIVTKTWQPGIIVKEDGSVTYSRLAKSQTLPATGEKETGVLSLLGLTALATGLGLTARRRHRG